MNADWTQNTARLKLLVGIMTALLVAGLVLLLVGMVRTASQMGRSDAPSEAAEPPLPSFGELKLALPKGADIVGMTASGSRLYIRARDAAGQAVVFVVDAERGRVLGRITLEAAP